MQNGFERLLEPEEPQNKCTCHARSYDECMCDYEYEKDTE